MSNQQREGRLRRVLKDNVFTNMFDYIFHKRHLTSRTRFKEIKRSKSSMMRMGGVGVGGAEGAPDEEGDEGVDALETVLMRMGEMGLYQWIMFVVMAPFAFMFAFVYFGQMFLTPTPQVHWCHVPALAGLPADQRRNLTAPLDPATNAPHRCLMYDTDYAAVKSTLQPPPAATPTKPCAHGWDFKYEDIPYPTITSERGWVCEGASYVYISQSLFFVGAFFGGFVFGYLADTVGRIPAIVGANMMAFFGGVATVYTTQFWDYCLARVMVGMAHDNCFMLLYILVLEYVGPKHRTFVANVSMAVFFGGGCVALPWVALGIGDWRTFVWVSTGPMAGVLLLPLIAPESARWLTSRGHLNRTIKVLDKVAFVNRRQVPRRLMNKFIAEFAETHEEESVMTLLRSRLLRRMLALMVVCYMSVMLVFDCIVRLSENLGLDFFLTFSLSAFTEIPSTLLVAFLLDRGGRRILTCVPMFVTGLFTCIAIFVPKGIAQAALAIGARFTVSMSYSAVTQWATEVLPTSVRGSGSAGVHVSGYLAIILSPLIVFSEKAWHELPFLVLTLLSLVGGLVGMLLPETVGLPLPQTMLDDEILVEEYSYYGKLTKKIQEGEVYLRTRFSATYEKPIVLKTDDTEGPVVGPKAQQEQIKQEELKKTEETKTIEKVDQRKLEQEEKRKKEHEEQIKREQEEQKKKKQEEQIIKEREEQKKKEQEEQRIKEQEEQSKKEQGEQSKKEQEERSKKEEEEPIKKEEEVQIKTEEEDEQRKKEQEEQRKKEQEERSKKEQDDQSKKDQDKSGPT